MNYQLLALGNQAIERFVDGGHCFQAFSLTWHHQGSQREIPVGKERCAPVFSLPQGCVDSLKNIRLCQSKQGS